MSKALGLAATAALGVALGAGLAGCANMPSGRERLVKAPPRCVDQTVQIYFAPEVAALTPEGRMVISQAAAGARGCKVTSVEVLGLADAAGAPAASLELSKKRADSVAQALAANGLPAAEFKLAAAGQAGAVNSDGQARPLRRRADVTLHLSPP